MVKSLSVTTSNKQSQTNRNKSNHIQCNYTNRGQTARKSKLNSMPNVLINSHWLLNVRSRYSKVAHWPMENKQAEPNKQPHDFDMMLFILRFFVVVDSSLRIYLKLCPCISFDCWLMSVCVVVERRARLNNDYNEIRNRRLWCEQRETKSQMQTVIEWMNEKKIETEFALDEMICQPGGWERISS